MGKFNVGDAVQLIDKPICEYSALVINSMFLHKIEGQKLVIAGVADDDGDYPLYDMCGRMIYLNANDLEPWEGIY